MDITRAGPDDVDDLARLTWLHAAPDEQERQSPQAFAGDLARWWGEQQDTHVAFLAREPDGAAIGMAWLALAPRVPRPGTTDRLSGDLQSVFVLPDHRSAGVGAALVAAACDHAERRGAARVTVHSSRLAVPLYERLGFAASPQLLLRPAEQPGAPRGR